MAAPTAAEAGFYGSDPSQRTDNTTNLGPVDYTAQLTDATLNLLFDSTPANAAGGADISHRNVIGIQNDSASGHMNSGKYYQLNGLRDGPGGGVLTINATAADAGKKIKVLAFVASVYTEDVVVLINGDATSVIIPAAAEFWRAEVLDSSDVATSAAGLIKFSQAGTDLGQIPAPTTDRNGAAVVFYCATKEFLTAKATAKNTSLSSADRLTDPASIGSYSIPILTATTDTSISLDDLDAGDNHELVVKRVLRAGVGPAEHGSVLYHYEYAFSAVA